MKNSSRDSEKSTQNSSRRWLISTKSSNLYLKMRYIVTITCPSSLTKMARSSTLTSTMKGTNNFQPLKRYTISMKRKSLLESITRRRMFLT